MDREYEIHYADNGAEQVINEDMDEFGDEANRGRQSRRLKPRWRVPTAALVVTAFLLGGGVVVSVECFAPDAGKISSIFGTFDARHDAMVEAAKIHQKARLDRYVTSLEVHKAQEIEQFRASIQALVEYYRATYELAKTNATIRGQLQQRYADQVYNLVSSTQATDRMVVNVSRLWGRIRNGLSEGSGEAALHYSDELKAQLLAELKEAASTDLSAANGEWDDTALPTPEEVEEAFMEFEPAPLPPPPDLWDDAYRPEAEPKE